MLDTATLSAIVKIEGCAPGKDPRPLGTGFVVSGDLVLTAHHVVKDQKRIQIRFGPDGSSFSPATIKYGSATLDWALLECDAARNIQPLRLGKLPCYSPNPYWRTFSFFRASGGYLSGPVQGRPPDRLDLRADEIGPVGSASVAGASGSPVISHGMTVGLIVTETLDVATGRVAGQSLKALPIEMVVNDITERHGSLVSLEPESLPFEAAFVDKLSANPAGTRRLATKLKVSLAGDVTIEVARALIRLGWEGMRQYLDELRLIELAELAECFWVDEGAAARLRAAVAGNHHARAAALNATRELTAKYYVRRADALQTAQYPRWWERAVTVSYTSPEIDGGTILQMVRRALTAPTRRDDRNIRTYVQHNQPIFVIIFLGQPITPVVVEDLFEIEETYAGVRPVVLTGPQMGTFPQQPGARQTITFVQPELLPMDEDEQLRLIRVIKGEEEAA